MVSYDSKAVWHHDLRFPERAPRGIHRQFEQGTLPKPIWTHAAHLAVGTGTW